MIRKGLSMILAIAVAVSLLWGLGAERVSAVGNVYYVSYTDGNDNNS